MPEVLPFEKQATFKKVEDAARSFVHSNLILKIENNIPEFYIPLLTRIIAYRHEFFFE